MKTLSILAAFLALIALLAGSESVTADQNPQLTPKRNGIINGTAAKPGRSWVAGLIYNYADEDVTQTELQFCGGSLIEMNWVLTAAHCVVSLEPSEIRVLLGSIDLDDPDAETVGVEEIVVHPFYPRSLSGNDIALLRLDRPVDLTPIALHDESSDIVLSKLPARVFGWGLTRQRPDETCELEFEDPGIIESDYLCGVKNFRGGDDNQQFLLQADQTIIEDLQCELLHQQLFPDSQTALSPLGDSVNASQNLCTADPDGFENPCYGDSGGPLVVNVGGEERLVGITSRLSFADCLETNDLNIYTKVAFYLEFIDQVIGRDPAMTFANFCPGSTELTVGYGEALENSVEVTLSWEDVEDETGYLLRYLDPSLPDVLGKIAISPDITRVSAIVPSGFDILVSIQAMGKECDGPASKLLSIKG